MSKKIAVLPGDGIGPEIVEQAVKVLKALGCDFEMEYADVGGVAYDALAFPADTGQGAPKRFFGTCVPAEHGATFPGLLFLLVFCLFA